MTTPKLTEAQRSVLAACAYSRSGTWRRDLTNKYDRTVAVLVRLGLVTETGAVVAITEAGRKAVGKPWLHVGLPGAKPMPVHQLDEADAAQKRLEAKKESHG